MTIVGVRANDAVWNAQSVCLPLPLFTPSPLQPVQPLLNNCCILSHLLLLIFLFFSHFLFTCRVSLSTSQTQYKNGQTPGLHSISLGVFKGYSLALLLVPPSSPSLLPSSLLGLCNCLYCLFISFPLCIPIQGIII